MFKGKVPIGWLGASGMPPLIWDGWEEEAERVHYRGLDELQREGWAEQGVYYLKTVSSGYTHFWSTKPMYSVDDLKGFKIRFYGSHAEVMEKLGASTIFLPHEEVYMAAATGTVDGSGTSHFMYEDLGLYEVCPYFYGPPWMLPGGMALFVAMDAWNALPDDLKAMVETAAAAYASESFLKFSEQYGRMLAKFPEWGVTYIEWGPEDIAKIRAASLEVLDEFPVEDPRVSKGVEIIKTFMRDKGYID